MKASHSPAESGSSCPRCSELEQELRELRAALARERELVNALRLSYPAGAEPALKEYPPSVGPGEPPLRYRVADALSDGLKKYLGPVHHSARAALRTAIDALPWRKS